MLVRTAESRERARARNQRVTQMPWERSHEMRELLGKKATREAGNTRVGKYIRNNARRVGKRKYYIG